MQFRLLLLAATLLISETLSAQRDLEYIADINSHSYSVLLNGRVLIAGNGNTYLDAFSDDDGMSRYPFPIVDGEPLSYASFSRPANYNSGAFFVLSKGTERYLYRFNGSTFSRLTIPGNIVSSPVVFGDNLYILSQSGTAAQLYRYNGTTVSAMLSGTIPDTRSYDLIVAGSYLYLVGQGYYTSEPYTVKRYSGTGFTTLPYFTFFNGISNIYPVGTNAYFMIGNYRILYFNGTSITTVYDLPVSVVHASLWRDNLYFLATIATEPAEVPLYRVNAGILSEITLPAGSGIFPHSDLAVYNDAIYLRATYGPSDHKVLQYDGARFTDFLVIPGTIRQAGTIFTREDDMVIQLEILGNANSYEYDGSSFTELRVPEGQNFASYLNSTDCHHLWLSLYYDKEDFSDPHRWGLLKESKGCPPPDTLVPVIPEHFFDFEKADISIWGKDRGWCWSEIIIDWDIEPCKFPDPCPPDPVYEIRLFDKGNKIAWQQKIYKPSALDVPLKDDQPYSARLSSATGRQHDLFVFADNLVERGIESIALSMKPGDNFFKIVATTDKSIPIALKVELLSKNGEVLWQKDFMAPFSEQVFDKVKVPGQTLRFSIPGTAPKSIITRLNIYPNPSNGFLTLLVKSGNKFTEAQLSITTLTGQKIIDRKIEIPFSQKIILNNVRPGIYVLKIITGKEAVSRIIRLE